MRRDSSACGGRKGKGREGIGSDFALRLVLFPVYIDIRRETASGGKEMAVAYYSLFG